MQRFRYGADSLGQLRGWWRRWRSLWETGRGVLACQRRFTWRTHPCGGLPAQGSGLLLHHGHEVSCAIHDAGGQVACESALNTVALAV